MSLDIPGGLKQEEVEAQRGFLETTGFLEPVSADELLEDLDRDESLDQHESLDRVFSADELLKDLGVGPNDLRTDDEKDDDLPMIEPVD